MIDGSSASYGAGLLVTSSSGSVSIPCPPGTTSRAVRSPAGGESLIGQAGICAAIPVVIEGDYYATVNEYWFPSPSNIYYTATSAATALSDLHSGVIQVAGISRPLSTNEKGWAYAWQIGIDNNYLVMRQADLSSTDSSSIVRGEDYIDYVLAHLAGARGFPSWDVNLDGAIGLADLGNISGRWGRTSSCLGWIRGDANDDGAVGLADIGMVTAEWGSNGFEPQSAPYDPTLAAAWADQHAADCNSWPFGANQSPYHCYLSDCTNFVSIALHQGGGMPFSAHQSYADANWYYLPPSTATASWSLAADLGTYLTYNHPNRLLGVARGDHEDAYSLLQAGDVFFYDFGDGNGISHSTIMTGSGWFQNDPDTWDPNQAWMWHYGDYIDQHSHSRFHQAWNLYFLNPSWATTMAYQVSLH